MHSFFSFLRPNVINMWISLQAPELEKARHEDKKNYLNVTEISLSSCSFSLWDEILTCVLIQRRFIIPHRTMQNRAHCVPVIHYYLEASTLVVIHPGRVVLFVRKSLIWTQRETRMDTFLPQKFQVHYTYWSESNIFTSSLYTYICICMLAELHRVIMLFIE